MSGARIHQINVSQGGVPKLPIEQGQVGELGLEGDGQAMTQIHGGPYRALSLLALEVIDALAAEGHPITPGSVGENITTEGLEWSTLEPGARLRLGSDVLIEVTSYATPCQTIAASFSDGNMNRINRVRAPGKSRLYAQVVQGGSLRRGDSIELEANAAALEAAISSTEGVQAINQVSVSVSNLERAIEFYRDRLGARYLFTVEPSLLAQLDVGGVRLMLDGPAHSQGEKPGATTIYFRVDDIDASYQAMRARGVQFDAAPICQYRNDSVEGWMAFFGDLDGNRLALASEVQV